MLRFSFRREKDKEFKHIAHGLIPAASIAPKPAVPRTPPPRSPNPSPERPRSALAAAILSSSLTGQTWAIPPARLMSLSESGQSESFTSEPNISNSIMSRFVSSPVCQKEYNSFSLAGVLRENKLFIKVTLEKKIVIKRDLIYVLNLQFIHHMPLSLPPEPSNTYSELRKKVVRDRREKNTRMVDKEKLLEERLQRLEREISSQAELQNLRQHAQELVDENDALKLTVHRLNVELSHYQARFRPLSKEEV
uniref:BZIP domain-containing protein n=1 Tax=Oreochromis aureus TaxID=47969 RepID=A0AAZ1XAF3_OREAU